MLEPLDGRFEYCSLALASADEIDLTHSPCDLVDEYEDLCKFASPAKDRWRHLLELGEVEVEFGHSSLDIPSYPCSNSSNRTTEMDAGYSALGLIGVPSPTNIQSSSITCSESGSSILGSFRSFTSLSRLVLEDEQDTPLKNQDDKSESVTELELEPDLEVIPIGASPPPSFALSPQPIFRSPTISFYGDEDEHEDELEDMSDDESETGRIGCGSGNGNGRRSEFGRRRNLSFDPMSSEFDERFDSPETDFDDDMGLDVDMNDEILITPFSHERGLPLCIRQQRQGQFRQPPIRFSHNPTNGDIACVPKVQAKAKRTHWVDEQDQRQREGGEFALYPSKKGCVGLGINLNLEFSSSLIIPATPSAQPSVTPPQGLESQPLVRERGRPRSREQQGPREREKHRQQLQERRSPVDWNGFTINHLTRSNEVSRPRLPEEIDQIEYWLMSKGWSRNEKESDMILTSLLPSPI